jgi:hypothetical protein
MTPTSSASATPSVDPDPSVTSADSTALFPPDWSQMVPDLVVALATGIAVGAAILLAERLMDRNRRRAAGRDLMWQISLSTSIDHSFIYRDSNLIPEDAGLKRLVKRVKRADIEAALVLESGAYVFLTQIVAAYENLRTTVEAIDRALENNADVMLDPTLKDRVMKALFFFALSGANEWSAEDTVPRWWEVSVDDRKRLTEMLREPDIERIARDYALTRRQLNALRLGFVAARNSILDSTRSVLTLPGAPRSNRQKIADAWRSWTASTRAARRRRDVNEEARVQGSEAYLLGVSDPLQDVPPAS